MRASLSGSLRNNCANIQHFFENAQIFHFSKKVGLFQNNFVILYLLTNHN